jgi:hypothetical protein
MKKIVSTILLVIIAIAALVWALSVKSSGLAWFPGFIIAVFSVIKILDVHGIDQESTKENRTGVRP